MNALNPGLRARRRNLGFSMVELMVALTVGLLLIGGMLATLVTSAGSGKSRERVSEIQNNGRFALDILKRDLQHAGFMGYTGVVLPDIDVPLTFDVTNKCENDFGKITIRVTGTDNGEKYDCLSGRDYDNKTDVVITRHFAPDPVALAEIEAGKVYFRSSYEGFEAYLGGSTPPNFSTKGWTPPIDYPYEETLYYISKFTNNKDENPKIPALWRIKLTSGPAMVPELVASGVENMQLRYRERITFGGASTYAWLGADNVSNWANVSAVEVSLLVRGSSREANLQNVQQYQVGEEIVKVANDGIPRQVFTTVVYLRNSNS